MSVAAVQNDHPFAGYAYIDEIQTLKKGYGLPLMKKIVEEFKKVWLMANTAAGDSLVDYYRDTGLFDEIYIEDSVYECPAYFFCTRECDYDRLEGYCNAFYANDDDRILLWATNPDKKLNQEREGFLDENIFELIEGTIEGEPIYDPETDLPLVQSRSLPPFAPPQEMEAGKLRFDGLYALPQKGFTSYLRFFPNGKVVCANSSGDKESVMRWLDEEFENSGHYLVWDDNIEFNIVEEDIEIGVSFKGTILDNALDLSWKQKATSRKVYTGRFQFI